MPLRIRIPKSELKKIDKELKQAVAKLKGEAIIIATEELYAATPKDTTNAANNWVPSIRQPASATFGSKANPNRGRQLEGIAKIRAWIAKGGDNSNVYLTNNVEYIEKLNAGSSRQAPANFVQSALSRVASRLKNVTFNTT